MLADLQKVFAAIRDRSSKLDIVFANDSIAAFVPLVAISEVHYDSIVNANRRDTIFTMAVLLFSEEASVLTVKIRSSLDRKSDLVSTLVRAGSCTLPADASAKKFLFRQILGRSGTGLPLSQERLKDNRIDPVGVFVRHPFDDAWYHERTPDGRRITVPLLDVANWTDWSTQGNLVAASKQKWLRLQTGDHLIGLPQPAAYRISGQARTPRNLAQRDLLAEIHPPDPG